MFESGEGKGISNALPYSENAIDVIQFISIDEISDFETGEWSELVVNKRCKKELVWRTEILLVPRSYDSV